MGSSLVLTLLGSSWSEFHYFKLNMLNYGSIQGNGQIHVHFNPFTWGLVGVCVGMLVVPDLTLCVCDMMYVCGCDMGVIGSAGVGVCRCDAVCVCFSICFVSIDVLCLLWVFGTVNIVLCLYMWVSVGMWVLVGMMWVFVGVMWVFVSVNIVLCLYMWVFVGAMWVFVSVNMCVVSIYVGVCMYDVGVCRYDVGVCRCDVDVCLCKYCVVSIYVGVCRCDVGVWLCKYVCCVHIYVGVWYAVIMCVIMCVIMFSGHDASSQPLAVLVVVSQTWCVGVTNGQWRHCPFALGYSLAVVSS